MRCAVRHPLIAALFLALLAVEPGSWTAVHLGAPSVVAAQTRPEALLQEKERPPDPPDTDNHGPHPLHEIDDAMVRLPLAALLGAALALRPRRRGTPPRTAPVVQTQIVLAVVGAVIMMVIGASLARAFGIVGAANLIRYRSKIDDPKDAVVMLCTLAVGLATGVGLYALAIFSTVFLVVALGIIESFEPKTGKQFDLKVRAGEQTDELRPQIEGILKRFNLRFELRTSSDEEVVYDVTVPLELSTDRVTNAILKLDPDGHAAVDWSEKKKKTP
ncbi:MAG TPA: MgtC/SapB family protein [Vicinamibacterales bacterium]|nr:MgtC/SapB family protein [Vicinamibacterales bacterium]